MKFYIDDLPVRVLPMFRGRCELTCPQIIFPYDRIYPGLHSLLNSQSHLVYISPTEQYAYMCDLKRTLDATVTVPPLFINAAATTSIGTLRARDAFRDGEDGFAPLLDRFLPTGN